MEFITFTTCRLQYERCKELTHRLTKRRPAAGIEYSYQQCERIKKLVDRKDHLEVDEQKRRKNVRKGVIWRM